jgi:chromosome segregation ATPase
MLSASSNASMLSGQPSMRTISMRSSPVAAIRDLIPEVIVGVTQLNERLAAIENRDENLNERVTAMEAQQAMSAWERIATHLMGDLEREKEARQELEKEREALEKEREERKVREEELSHRIAELERIVKQRGSTASFASNPSDTDTNTNTNTNTNSS